MPNWGSDDTELQRREVDTLPQSAATGPAQGCVCPPPTPVKPATPVPVIVKVEWLDGPGTGVLAGQGLQFVNLPVDAKWVGGPLATNARRLSNTPGYKVTFNQPGSYSFKVRLVPDGANAAYTAGEEGRNGKFKAEREWVSGTTEADGTRVIETGSALTVAGGDSYKLEAQDDQATLVSSAAIKTIRAVHCVQIKMTGLTATATSIADCIGEYAKHHVKLVDLPSVEMPRLHNVGTDTAALRANVATAWDASQGKAKEPYALGMVFTDHLAVKNPDQTLNKAGVQVGPGKGPEVIDIVGPGLTNAAVRTRSLWKDLVPGEGWFVSASFTPDGGAAAIPIDTTRCTTVPAAASDCSQVSVDVSALPAGTGTLSLTVNWVDRMRGGISLGGSATVLVCTRAWWTDISTRAQNETLTHEVGHQFGMVPEGTSGLDRHDNQYTGSGHVGSHCHNGVPAAANYGNAAANAASTCVIFGSTNGKLAYCAKCAPQVRKVDLTPGW